MKVIFLVAFLLPSLAVSASSPKEAATKYAEAAAKEDWSTALKQFRPTDLRRIRSAFAAQLAKPESARFSKEIFGDLSGEQITKLADLDFCTKLFAGQFSSFRERGIEIQIKDWSILGVVSDGESLAYAVVKQNGTVAGREIGSVDVIPTILDSGEWYVGIPKQFESVVSMWEKR